MITSQLKVLKWWNFTRAPLEFQLANHKSKMIYESFKKVKAWKLSGSYMEFGVYKGQSIVFAHQHMKSLFGDNKSDTNQFGINHIFAFDSFSGIGGVTQDELSGPFQDGDYAFSLKDFTATLELKRVPTKSITVVPGFFETSLTKTLQDNIVSRAPRVAVLNIDCDIYAPSLLALKFCEPMLAQSTIVLFDDFFSYGLHPNKGEFRALREFKEAFPKIVFHEWMNYGPVGKSFIIERLV